jgi:hypothetical protein
MWNQRRLLRWTALSLLVTRAVSFAPSRSVTSKNSLESASSRQRSTRVPTSAAVTTRLNQSVQDSDGLASAQRRNCFGTVGMAALTLWAVPPPQPAHADVDYSRIQDLLGPGGDYATTYSPNAAAVTGTTKRPTYLTEPTDEFKASEAKATEFRRKNTQVVAQFNALLEAVGSVPNDETKLAATLDQVRRLVKANGGLPIGITKDDIVKTCRRRKAKKYWPTTVEVAYVRHYFACVCVDVLREIVQIH